MNLAPVPAASSDVRHEIVLVGGVAETEDVLRAVLGEGSVRFRHVETLSELAGVSETPRLLILHDGSGEDKSAWPDAGLTETLRFPFPFHYPDLVARVLSTLDPAA